MHPRLPRPALLFSRAAAILILLPLASCGKDVTPSPTNAALNAPEGSPERAPTRPEELKPPATPPSPGHIGH